jgi:hypothetical protein
MELKTMQSENQLKLIKHLKMQPKQGSDPLGDVAKQLKGIFDSYNQGGQDIARENVFGFLAKQAQDVYEKLNVLEERNYKVQAGFKLSTREAAKLGQQFDSLGKSIGANSDKLKTYLVELNKTFAGQAKFFREGEAFTTQISKETDLIRNKLKVSDDAFQGFLKFQVTANKESQKGNLANQFIKSGDAVAQLAQEVSEFYTGAITDLVEGLGSLPASIQATMGQYPKQLGLAVLKSKQLGLSLEKVQGVAEGMLDIEKAIGAEIEYQILSGEELTTTSGESLTAELQKAAIQQDANKQVDLLTDFLGKNGEKLKDNIYLANQVADMFGLSKDELFGAYQQLQANQEISERLFKQQTNNDAAITTSLKDQVDLADQRTQKEILADDAQQAYVKELLSAYGTPEKMEEQVIKLAKLGSEMQTAALTNADKLVKSFENSDFVKFVFGAGGFVKTIKDAFDLITTGTVAGSKGSIGESAGGVVTSEEDIFIPGSGTGNIVRGPKGSFALDPDDDIIAMPNARQALANRGGGDTSAVIAALKGMSFHVTNVFDGDKIRSSLQIRQGQQLNNTNIV